MHSQQLRGMQGSKLGLWRGYHYYLLSTPSGGLPAFLQMYFIIAPDCPRIFPSGVTRNGIWPSGGLPAEIMKQKRVSNFLNILCCILENCCEWWKHILELRTRLEIASFMIVYSLRDGHPLPSPNYLSAHFARRFVFPFSLNAEPGTRIVLAQSGG